MLLALSVLLAAPNAVAGEGEITFCNKFPHKIYVAIAYLQTDVNSHLSRGWLNVETGKCYVFDTGLRVDGFYYYAESDTYKQGKDKVKTSWGKGQKFSIRDNSFQTYNAEKDHTGMKLVEFSKFPISSEASVTAIVTFQEDASVTSTVPGKGGGGGAERRGFRPKQIRRRPSHPARTRTETDAAATRRVRDGIRRALGAGAAPPVAPATRRAAI
jgi:uncharacterized membrane protein